LVQDARPEASLPEVPVPALAPVGLAQADHQPRRGLVTRCEASSN
jgi:hypothetical protein